MMIDITVSNNEVYVEYENFHSFNDKENLARMIQLIIHKAKYSGESISLFIADRETKRLKDQW